MQRDSRGDLGIFQGAKQIDKLVMNYSSSCSFSPYLMQGSVAPANSRDEFQVFSRRKVQSIKTRKGGPTLADTKSQP